MKRARKMPRRVFLAPAAEAEIRRTRMLAYLEKTREGFKSSIEEARKLSTDAWR